MEILNATITFLENKSGWEEIAHYKHIMGRSTDDFIDVICYNDKILEYMINNGVVGIYILFYHYKNVICNVSSFYADNYCDTEITKNKTMNVLFEHMNKEHTHQVNSSLEKILPFIGCGCSPLRT